MSFKGLYTGKLYRLAGAEWPQGWSSFSLCNSTTLLIGLEIWFQSGGGEGGLIGCREGLVLFCLFLKVSISSRRLLRQQLLIVTNWQPLLSTKPQQVLMAAVWQLCVKQVWRPPMAGITVAQTEVLKGKLLQFLAALAALYPSCWLRWYLPGSRSLYYFKKNEFFITPDFGVFS